MTAAALVALRILGYAVLVIFAAGAIVGALAAWGVALFMSWADGSPLVQGGGAVPRRAHNPQIAGSTPAPATNPDARVEASDRQWPCGCVLDGVRSYTCAGHALTGRPS